MEARAHSHDAGVARRERKGAKERETETEIGKEVGRCVHLLKALKEGWQAGGKGEGERRKCRREGRRERERGGSGRLPSAYSQRYLPSYTHTDDSPITS